MATSSIIRWEHVLFPWRLGKGSEYLPNNKVISTGRNINICFLDEKIETIRSMSYLQAMHLSWNSGKVYCIACQNCYSLFVVLDHQIYLFSRKYSHCSFLFITSHFLFLLSTWTDFFSPNLSCSSMGSCDWVLDNGMCVDGLVPPQNWLMQTFHTHSPFPPAGYTHAG
jgi:hypothetical protein